MKYRITKGDAEITKNVLREITRRLKSDLEKEKRHFEYESECPSYDMYQASIDMYCYTTNHAKTLTNS